jgi:hypothetical protein
MVCNGNCVCTCGDKFTGVTRIGFVVDESGSMMGCRNATISGFNEYLETQKRASVSDEVVVTLTKFADEASIVYKNQPLATAPLLTHATYNPAGSTALFDAVGRTVNAIQSQMRTGDRALIVIITDGEENNSKEMNKNTISTMIKNCEALGNWTFTYMGANQDAWNNGIGLGMQRANVINYTSTPMGTNMAFAAVANSTIRYRSSSGTSVADFYDGHETVDESFKEEWNKYHKGIANAVRVEILDEDGNKVS